jgi:major membrane immunogen (membrane-anchored lipoprotein)
MKRILPFVLVALVILVGCKPSQKTQTTASQDGKYSEDLSSLRPKIEQTPDNT